MQIAQRIDRLGTETSFVVLARARELEAQGKDIVHLEIGEPDFDTAPNIIEAAKNALDAGYTHYGPAAGLPQFRKTIAEVEGARRGLEFKPDMVVVTPGAKPIMYYAIMAIVNPGDEVIYPNPGFPIYESAIELAGGTAVPLPLLESKGFSFNIDDLKSLITPKTRMIVINSPQNPTGGILSQEDLREIAELAVKHDLWVLTDEIYGRVTYDGFKNYTIASYPGMMERTIILDGFSKTYAMTGWRLGYGIMPKHLAEVVAKLQTNVASCTASFIQVAGIEALTGPQDWVDNVVEEFRRRRDLIVDGMNSLPGFKCHKPLGAFYVFPNTTGTGMDSRTLANKILNEGGVACLSGSTFGKYGEGYVRFSYANSMENIEKGIDRIRKLLS
ncbi:MAG: pyridoxal phosphate-dependent aminotransferase [Bacteroidota bacterium]|nr:pyridoxal phosphate-dependent aminotransferase [Bacteroidota bacterium]MDP4232655.1 pyridoxal phosphate-dependent aminotransferase [Bacteroidota bacterium]MDP4243907.1 pyridoxal phosphate-dependent aminotransferase [Bacteroidota bacterium]MDP4288424.1 pyridoxal phosphate-dependent aminotransferase [Bacteroidota bacterium]